MYKAVISHSDFLDFQKIINDVNLVEDLYGYWWVCACKDVLQITPATIHYRQMVPLANYQPSNMRT